MFSQILVGSGTSLVNFVIHAMLLAAMVRAIEWLSSDDAAAPAFVQHTPADRGDRRPPRCRPSCRSLALGGDLCSGGGSASRNAFRLFRLRQLHDARLWR